MIQKNGSGLEYHVPAAFTPARPAIAFQHIDHSNTRAQDHPVASLIPSTSGLDRPTIVGDPAQLAALYRPSSAAAATQLADYLLSDRPVLGLTVTSFRDKTLVTLNWSHLAFDIMGLQAVLHGWTAVLQGRAAADVPAPFGFDRDPLAGLGSTAAPARQAHVLADRLLSIGALAVCLGRRAYGLLVRPAAIRMVCIPAAVFRRLRERAVEEAAWAAAAAADASSEAPGGPPWLSDNDVLEAFWLRLAVGSLDLASGTTVSLRPPPPNPKQRRRREKERKLAGQALIEITRSSWSSKVYQ